MLWPRESAPFGFTPPVKFFEEKLMRSVRIGTIRGAILVAMLVTGGVIATQAAQAPAADKAKSKPVEAEKTRV